MAEEEEAVVEVGSINHPGQPRTKDPSRNTKGRKPRLVMMMNNMVISLSNIHTVYHASSTVI